MCIIPNTSIPEKWSISLIFTFTTNVLYEIIQRNLELIFGEYTNQKPILSNSMVAVTVVCSLNHHSLEDLIKAGRGKKVIGTFLACISHWD